MIKTENARAFVKKVVPLTVLLLFVATSIFVSGADNVVILEKSNPDLTFVKIHEKSEFASSVWDDITGDFSQKENHYTLTSNGYAQWYEVDSLHFAYDKIIYKYNAKASLTVETQLDAFDGKRDTAGAGLMLRSGVEANAATIMLHARPNEIMITYRSATGVRSMKGSVYTGKLTYPIKFKAVLNKNKVECYYQMANQSKMLKLGTVPFVYNSYIYAGISAYSQEEKFIATSKYNGFSYYIEAPEGTEIADENTNVDDTVTEEEEEIILPPDPSISEDVLLYETFSDGSISEGQASVTNPIWETSKLDPEIVLDETQTNRYLYTYMEESYYKAGNEEMTDYELELDVNFTSNSAPYENNQVDVYTRLTSIDQYGYHAYVVRFSQVVANENEEPTRTITLGYLNGEKKLATSSNITVVDTYDYNYLEKAMQDKPRKLRVRVFDNTIKVYLDDIAAPILSWVDDTANVKTTGCIGFSTNNSATTFDNIKVVGLDDLLGGDYDNAIGGLWNEATPSYIQEEFIKNNYTY